MLNPQFPTARRTGLVIQEIPDELLVYDTESNKAHCLNHTAAFVWKSCDGSRSAADIAGLCQDGKMSEDIVWLAIDQLNENDLLEQQVKSVFAGQSRREVLKKIGFASVVALPVIASLVAPKNVMAAASCTCTTQTQCFCNDGSPQCMPIGCSTGTNCVSSACVTP